MIFLTSNIVQTQTEHFEPEHFLNVCIRDLLEPNLECRFRLRPKTPESKPNQTLASLLIYNLIADAANQAGKHD
jgi:hypothetical protein